MYKPGLKLVDRLKHVTRPKLIDRGRMIFGVASPGDWSECLRMEKNNRSDRFVLGAVAFLGFLGVIGGAIGAHPPGDFLGESDSRAAWNSAAVFLLFHAIMIFAITDPRRRSLDPFRGCVVFFILGMVLFSGSIFALSAGAPRYFGPVTPIGGLCLLCGWFFLAVRLLRPAQPENLSAE